MPGCQVFFGIFTKKIDPAFLRSLSFLNLMTLLIKSQPLCKMHSSNSRAVHFAPPAGGLLNAQGAQGRPLHTSPAKFLCIFLSCCYFETTRFRWLPYGVYFHNAFLLRQPVRANFSREFCAGLPCGKCCGGCSRGLAAREFYTSSTPLSTGENFNIL